MYPDDWTFVRADIYGYAARQAVFGYRYDLVTLDPPTDQFQRCADHLELWCQLARRLVVVGTGRDTTTITPPGWTITDYTQRSDFHGGVYWTVLEPA